MALLKFKTKEEIPDDLKDVAEETKDGDATIWAVKVAPAKKVDEFRENNVNLARKYDAAEAERKNLRKALGLKDDDTLDVEKLTTELTDLRDTKKLVNDGKLEKKEDIEKEIEKRTAQMRQALEDKAIAATQALAKEKQRGDEFEGKFKRTFIDRDAYQVCNDPDLGVEPWALPYILQDAYGLFQVEGEGKIIPKRDGSIVYGESGTDPMTLKEWIDGEVRKTKPQFFKKSAGGGAQGGSGDASKFGGLSEADFNKLPPEKRLAIANEMEAKQRARSGSRK